MVASRHFAVDVDTGLEGDGEDVVVVLAIVIERKRFSDLKLLLIVNVFIINQVIKSIMHIANEILLGIFFVIIFSVALPYFLSSSFSFRAFVFVHDTHFDDDLFLGFHFIHFHSPFTLTIFFKKLTLVKIFFFIP